MDVFFVAFIKGDIFVATLIRLLEHARSKQRCIFFLTLMKSEGHYKDDPRWRMKWMISSLKEVAQDG
jgi:hypothetical protein